MRGRLDYLMHGVAKGRWGSRRRRPAWARAEHFHFGGVKTYLNMGKKTLGDVRGSLRGK